MTRLKTQWIEHMVNGMQEYNRQLESKCGMDLRHLVQSVFLVNDEAYEEAVSRTLVSCIPITQGQGIIGSFSQSIAAIVNSMGFTAWAEEKTDVDGIYSASLKNANLYFMADDVRYLAVNPEKNRVSDNNYATALGFICVLRQMMMRKGFDISKEKILVIGIGTVGKEACRILENHDIDFDIYDINKGAYDNLKDVELDSSKYVKLSGKQEIKNYRFILDYTNIGGWMEKDDLAADTLYASPGVPLSLTEEAAEYLGKDAVYDNLEIGTAMMLGQTLFT